MGDGMWVGAEVVIWEGSSVWIGSVACRAGFAGNRVDAVGMVDCSALHAERAIIVAIQTRVRKTLIATIVFSENFIGELCV